jgi:mycofactocin precursor
MDERVAVVAEAVDSTRPQVPGQDAVEREPELVDELLVEEVSIDGMCGVY